MSTTVSTEKFGGLLKFLRKRAHLTQRELAQAVGYTEAHICRLEKDERLPDLTTIAALFIPALGIKNDPVQMERLLKLAAQTRNERQPASVKISQITIKHRVEQELGALEEIPAPSVHNIDRPGLNHRVNLALASERSVVLCGMAGIGKTTLAAAAAREYEAGPVFWHTLTAGVNTSVEAIVRQLALFFLANGQTEVRPLVGRRTDAAPMPLDQQVMLLRSALARQPALLCFDDVHLLIENEPSLSLLGHLTAATSASLIFTSRQDVPLSVMQINLKGLELGEARELVKRLGLALDPVALDRLLTRTDHNPMLLRLVMGQLLETHMDAVTFIEQIETQPQVASYLLRTILNDLSPSAHWLAQLISVFRHPVDLYNETLNELIEKNNPDIRFADGLNQIRHRCLIDNARHAALHPLVRDHLYATLAVDVPFKKRLHCLAAEWSERALGDVVEAAYHWTRAGDLQQAAETIGDQSEQLFNRGLAPAVIQVVEDALERTKHRRGDTTSLRRRLLTARGNLLQGTLRAAEAETSYREALALAQNLPTVRAQIIRSLAQILLQRGQPAEALSLCQSAISRLTPAGIILLARLAAIECRAHLALSHYDEAEQTAKRAITLAEQFAEIMPQLADDVRARAERTLGWINYTRHPQGAESLVHYRRALECARRAGARAMECAILSNIGTALVERGDLNGALQSYQEALKGFEALGDMYSMAGVLHNLGGLYNFREEFEPALAMIERASEIEWSVGDLEGWLSTEQARASLLLSMGRINEARSVLDRALVEDRGSSDTWTIGSCLCSLVEVQLLQGELNAARSTAGRALAMPGIKDNARIRAWALSGLALVQLTAGEIGTARQTVVNTPPDDLGFELTTRWRLVQCAVALASGDITVVQSHARSVIDAAKQNGSQQGIFPAEKMISNPDLPISDLPRLIIVGNST